MIDTRRADEAHAMAKKAYDAAMRELSKLDDLGMVLAACTKCGTWLMAEASAVTYLESDDLITRQFKMSFKDDGDD